MTDPHSCRAIYKILTPPEWAYLLDAGQSFGSALDQADGYIHFSTRAQLEATLNLHYKGAGTVIIAEILSPTLDGCDLRWEPARDGSLFPHLYGALRGSMIHRRYLLQPDADGVYGLPDLDP